MRLVAVILWLAATAALPQQAEPIAELPFPAACVTATERTECAYATLEALKVRHNAMGVKVAAGTLSLAQFNTWRHAWWWPRHMAAASALVKVRPLAIQEPRFGEDNSAYAAARRAWQASKRFPVELDTFKATPEIAPPDPTEDLTGFTETDTGGFLTVNATTVTVTAMTRAADSHVGKSYGAGHFGDYTHLFDCMVTATSGTLALMGLWGVSNQIGSYTDISTGQVVHWYDNAGTETMQLVERTGGVDEWFPTLNTAYYCTVKRAATTGTLVVYSDAARTKVVDNSVSLAVASTTYANLLACYSREAAGTITVSGYTQNFDIQEAAAVIGFPNPILDKMRGGLHGGFQ